MQVDIVRAQGGHVKHFARDGKTLCGKQVTGRWKFMREADTDSELLFQERPMCCLVCWNAAQAQEARNGEDSTQ